MPALVAPLTESDFRDEDASAFALKLYHESKSLSAFEISLRVAATGAPLTIDFVHAVVTAYWALDKRNRNSSEST